MPAGANGCASYHGDLKTLLPFTTQSMSSHVLDDARINSLSFINRSRCSSSKSSDWTIG